MQVTLGGKTEALGHRLAAIAKPILTLDSPANMNLVSVKARVIRVCQSARGPVVESLHIETSKEP